MARYSDRELERLLADGESDLVERKSSAGDRSRIRRNICAFANDLPGHRRAGVIFVGVDDRGGCTDLPITDRLLSTLAQMKSDGNILPLPSLTVEKRVVSGCELALVTVEPSRDLPVRYQGRVYVKTGPTVRLASAEEERRLEERRRASDLPFDMRPAEAALDDLALDYIEAQYLPRAIAVEVLEQNQRPLDQQLRSLRLVVGGRPCHGALLAFGRDPLSWLPGAFVQFLRVDGPKITDPIRDQKRLSGRLEDVLRHVDETIEINVSTQTDVLSESREVNRPDYPVVALKQLARNAIMHRNYEGTNAPVRITWYSDRVEIQNPGGLYGQVTTENFGTGVTDYRNPLVGEIMHNLGFVQRFGLGVPLAREELEKNGNPPAEFVFEPAHVAVTVRPAR